MARRNFTISSDLKLPLDWATLATVVYGARGSGKTSLGRVFAEEAHAAGLRFCAIDLKGDWWGLKSSADGKSEGLPVVVLGGDHQDVPLEHGAGKFVGETVAKLEQSCILDLEYFSKGKQVRFLTEFFLSLYDANREPLVVLMDEAQRYAPQSRMPDPESAKCLGAVEDLVKLGRKHGIAPVLFTQRGSGLNKEVSELCDLLVAFRTPGPLDQDRVKDWLDANTTKPQRDQVMGQLSGLATGTAVFASGHPDLKVFGVHAVRRPETFDSSATPKVGQRRVEPKKLAKPDLEQLKVRMAEAIERAAADDPKALKARVAKAEGELAKLRSKPAPEPKAAPAPKVPPVRYVKWSGTEPAQHLNAAGVALRGGQVEAKKFRIGGESLLKQLRDLRADVDKKLTAIEGGLTAQAESFVAVTAKSIEAEQEIVATGAALLKLKAVDPLAAETSAEAPVMVPTPQAARPARNAAAVEGAVKLSPCERGILIAVMQHGRLNLRQASIIAGYSIGSSTPSNAAGKLRALGLLEGSNTEGFTASSEAAGAVGDFDPLPTGAALAEYWIRQHLSPCEAAILRYALDHHPGQVALKDAAESGAYSISSSTPSNAAGKLRTLGLIEGSNGAFAANESLVG